MGAQLGIPSYFRQYAYGALFALLPDPTHTFGNHLQQVYSGEGCSVTLGFLPTGTPWESGLDTLGDGAIDTRADFTSTMFHNLRHDEFDKWERGGLAKWKDECCELMPDAADLIQQGITHRHQVAFATYADGIMWRFNAGKIVCIGDCSHSMSPQLGQGANLALIDAAKLVDCLEQTPDVNAALNQYTRDRWSRVTFYQAHSRLLTPIFASRSRSLRVLRDHLMYYMCHTPLLETYIHGILCGAISPRVFTTIPKEEYLGFLDDPRV